MCRFITTCKAIYRLCTISNKIFTVDVSQQAGQLIDFALHVREYIDFAQIAREYIDFAQHARDNICRFRTNLI